ncbi:MAG: hypothetical protein MJ252_19660 [archaeon]|nr:hypothetical protein [archaeon]
MKEFFSLISNPSIILFLIPIFYEIFLSKTKYASPKYVSLCCLILFCVFNLIKNFALFDIGIILAFSISVLVIEIIQFCLYQSIDPNDSTDRRKYIYIRHFKQFGIKERDFLEFMNKGIIRKQKLKSFNLCLENTSMDKFILILKVDDDQRSTILVKKQGKYIYNLYDGDWIGISELFNNYFKEEAEDLQWDTTVECKNDNENEICWIEWKPKYFWRIFDYRLNTKLTFKFQRLWSFYLCKKDYILKESILENERITKEKPEV